MPRNSATKTPTKGAAQTSQRERLVRVAAKLFAKNGYHATGVAQLGDAMGLGRGALYHHMGDKENLLEEISIRHVEQMVEFGETVLADDLTPPEQIRALSRKLMETIMANLDEITVFFREVHSLRGKTRRHVFEQRERYEAIWRTVLDQGVERGYFRMGGPLVTKSLLGMHNYSYVWISKSGELSAAEMADVFCDLVLPGLLTDEARAGTLGKADS
jgi:AcrR family transcriptional regulator